VAVWGGRCVIGGWRVCVCVCVEGGSNRACETKRERVRTCARAPAPDVSLFHRLLSCPPPSPQPPARPQRAS
jgi:hypothetical protein